MRLNTYIKSIRRQGQRHFTLQQATADLHLSGNAARVAVHRLYKQGELISPAKGLYLIVPPEHQRQGASPPAEVVPVLMQYLQTDYYVSLLSAAQYYGAAHQKPTHFQVITNRRSKHPLQFGQVKIELTYKKSLAGLPVRDFVVDTGYLKVAAPELVALDLLKYPTKSGGLNHIATVLSELIEAIEVAKLIELAEMTAATIWLQRMGYILEQIAPMEPEKVQDIVEQLATYLATKPKRWVPLAPELPRTGCPRIKKWQLIANTTIESDL